jgi:hypothetical protein
LAGGGTLNMEWLIFRFGCFRDEYLGEECVAEFLPIGEFCRLPRAIHRGVLLFFFDGIGFRAAGPRELRKYSFWKIVLGPLA